MACPLHSRSVCLARSLLRLGLPDEAVAPLQRALSAVSSDEDRFAAASLLGMARMHRGYGAEAIAAYNVAIDAARALRDPNREAHALFNLALAYEGESPALALGLLLRSLDLAPRSALVLIATVSIYQEQRRWKEARPLASRAVREARDGRSNEWLLPALLQLADVERHLEQHGTALSWAREAAEIALARHDVLALALAYEILTEIFIDLDEPGEATIYAFAAMATLGGAGNIAAVDRIASRMKEAFEQPKP